MVIRAIISALLVMVAGCSSRVPEPRIVIKEVPIEVCEDPFKGLERRLPDLPIHHLTSRSSPQVVSTSYVDSVSILMDEVRWYRKAMNLN